MRNLTRKEIKKADALRPIPDWLKHALEGRAGTAIIPLNKAAGAKRNLSIGEISKLIGV